LLINMAISCGVNPLCCVDTPIRGGATEMADLAQSVALAVGKMIVTQQRDREREIKVKSSDLRLYWDYRL
jgi:hypothetical protein